MAEVFPDSENSAPEEVTQQISRKSPAPDEITQQTRVKLSGLEGETRQEPDSSAPEPSHETAAEGTVQPEAASTPQTVVMAAKPSAVALQPPRRTFFGRVGHALFSNQTRFGRFTRSAFATLVTVVFLFGVWAIVAYFLIYRPMTNNLASLQVEATQTSNQLQQASSAQKAAEQKVNMLSTQSAQDQNRLKTDDAHIALLRGMDAISSSRFALANNDLNAASTSLAEAQGYLNDAYPSIEQQNPKQAETIRALFTVANNDLAEIISTVSGTTTGSASGAGSTPTVDTSLVDQDLLRIQNELDQAEKNIK